MSFWYVVLAIILAIVIYQFAIRLLIAVVLGGMILWRRLTWWYRHGKIYKDGRKNPEPPPRIRINLFLSRFRRNK